MTDLTDLRQQIDEIDARIVELYEKRMEISGQVAQYKIETGKKERSVPSRPLPITILIDMG